MNKKRCGKLLLEDSILINLDAGYLRFQQLFWLLQHQNKADSLFRYQDAPDFCIRVERGRTSQCR